MELRCYQQKAVDAVLAEYAKGVQRTLVVLPTGAGKCLAKGTPVLMFDGSIKAVEDVEVGDLLMGPDSKPRRVLSLARGMDHLYHIIPTKGEAYCVNEAHILSLKMTKGATKGSGSKGSKYIAGTIIDISVRDYLQKSKTFKHCAKGYRVGVEFSHKDTPIDPYFLGLWLGDGSNYRVEITTADKEIVDYLAAFAPGEGLRLVKKVYGGNCPNYALSIKRKWTKWQRDNRLLRHLRRLQLFKNKHIPAIYKANTRQVRLEVLAGLLDSDGHMHNGGYDLCLKDERLANDAAYVARSLGLAAYVKPCQKTCRNNGVVGNYFRVSISGDCSDIPVKLPRKKAPKRQQKKDVLSHGIRVQYAGVGEYFGFEIDGDRRFLLGDFTVTHNTVVFAHVAKRLLEHGRILVLAHRDELIRQAANKLARITGVQPAIEKADERSFEESMHGKPQIVVSSIQTQISGRGDVKRMHRFNPREFAAVMLDEAHHGMADSYQKVLAYYLENKKCVLLGVTATADRADGKPMGGVFESVAYDYELPDIINDGYLVPIEQRSVVIAGLDFSRIRTVAGDLNQGDLEAAMLAEEPLHGIAHAVIEVSNGLYVGALNPLRDDPDRIRKVQTMIDTEVHAGEAKRRRTLIFATSVAHAERLAEIINRWLPDNPAEHIDGSMSTHLRRDKLRRFADGRLQYLVNCMIATEGFDEPGVELVVMARPTKSRPLFAQMVGRGTRPAESIAAVLGTLATPDERRACIAASEKTCVEILDFVGNSGRHKLVSTLDLLGDGYSEDVLAMAREKAKAQAVDVQDVLEESKEEIERKKREAEEAKRKREEEAERRRQAEAAKRAGLVGTTHYELAQVDSFDQSAPSIGRAVKVAPKHLNILRKAKVPDTDIARLSVEDGKRLAQEIVRRWKLKLCNYKQAKLLQKCGYSKAETRDMTYADASAAIDGLKARGWKRQGVAA